ncbi:MAG: hypothetical protein WD627_04865, partial [Actinomycetota bacterium]
PAAGGGAGAAPQAPPGRQALQAPDYQSPEAKALVPLKGHSVLTPARWFLLREPQNLRIYNAQG